ncbi:MAG: SIS domain-containing protein, partial [Bacteroidota bacterium]
MTPEEIRRLDPTGMHRWILDFPKQVEDAVRIGTETSLRLKTAGIRSIVLTGLGGSAIGGDLLRSYLAPDLAVPFIVNRHYVLPKFVDRNSLVIVSSYSGNTEETIAAHKDAIKRKARVLCISTNGKTEELARKHRQALITIPAGLSPRAALAYSFFPLLVAFGKLKLIKPRTKDIKETVRVLSELATRFGNPASPDNAPLRLAERFRG